MRAADPTPRSRQRAPVPSRPLGLPLVALLLCLLAPILRAGDEAARDRLVRAQTLELVEGDLEGALDIYESVARLEGEPPDVRADALTGAARCHKALGRPDRAAKYWKDIVGDAELREEARALARKELAERARVEIKEGNGGRTDAAVEEALQRMLTQRRQRARERVESARRALAAGRFEAARSLCFEALALDHENEQASALLQQIESRRPDRGDLLRRLIDFLQTAQLEEYERLKAKVAELHRDGRLAFDRARYAEADRLFREAIRRIDESDFLAAGGALHLDSLETERTSLLQWLRETHDKGSEAGLSFEPEPPLPDLEARSGGLQKEFYGLMARIFSPQEPGQEPLRFYEFAPSGAPPGAQAKRLVSSNFFDGLRAGHSTGSLTRARWAERWVRRNVGARWADPARAAADAPRGARILARFGSMICAQHREAEHRRIRRLADAFAMVPPALRVDVQVYAANSGGAVGAADKLRARAGPRDSGLDVVVHGRLIEECVRDLADVKGLVRLGSAQILLEGESAITLDLTRLTAAHPSYARLDPPALTVPDADARYGLWLDLYAEDMPNRTQPGNDRSALSVRARVLQPGEPQGSHVVPQVGPDNVPWTRLPLLTEQVQEADRELPHFATFMMLGLANPFPKTREQHGELVVLIGTRRQDTPTPDAPRTPPSPRIVPEDAQTKDYLLGPLASEVQDEVVPEGWPEQRAATEAVTGEDLRKLRRAHLALLLGEMAGVEGVAPGEEPPVIVGEQHATANLSSEEHVRLQQAVQRLRSQENALYAVDIRSALVPTATWTTWSAAEGVTVNDRGTYQASGVGRQDLERHLDDLVAEGGLFASRRTLLARATQQVAHLSVRARAITKDLRVRLLDHNRQRYSAIPGSAEEGLIVEVRPGIEQPDLRLRSVTVRVRAARLERIDSRPYPRATQAAARYDVPVWYAGSDGAFSQRADAEILDDRKALFLALPLPGQPEQTIVVEVAVRKVQ